MLQLCSHETQAIRTAEERFHTFLDQRGISLQLRGDFSTYLSIRAAHGDGHLNQVFDPRHTKFGSDDFWLLAENIQREPIATYCLRRFVVEDFYDPIRSLTLWFARRRQRPDPRYIVDCKIAPFGGEVVHGGGLWVRNDYRGASRLGPGDAALCSGCCFASSAVRPRQRDDPQ
jgi:hypothetical protein